MKNLKKPEKSCEEKSTLGENFKRLDKTTLNNQIVKMRKTVRQAKVHIIHKLTRNIASFRNRKGNERMKAKAERKAERLVKKIQYIKKTSEDEISKFALISTHDMDELSKDIKMPLRTQVMALIAIHKVVSASIEEFKSTFPEFQKVMPALLKKRKKRNLISASEENCTVRTKTINQKPEQVKDISESWKSQGNHRRDEEISDGSDQFNQNSHQEGEEIKKYRRNQNESSSCNEEMINDDDTESSIDGKMSSSNCDRENGNSDVDSKSELEPDQQISTAINKKIIGKELGNPKNNQTYISKNKKSTPNRPIKYHNTLSKNASITELVVTNPKVVDPFFVTSTNKEYLTDQVSDLKEDNLISFRDGHEFKTKSFSKFTERDKCYKGGWRNDNLYSNERHYFKNDFKTNNCKKNENDNGIILGNRKQRRQALNKPIYQNKIEKLHPSWEAKKKTTSIATFQGKKLTFD